MAFSHLTASIHRYALIWAAGLGVLALSTGMARLGGPTGDRAGSPAAAGSPSVGKSAGCAADIAYPIRIVVTPQDPIRPGGRVRARVEVVTDLPMDEVELRVLGAPGVGLLTAPRTALGPLRAGEARIEEFEVILPPGRDRRTVEVRAVGMRDGESWPAAAVLNLVIDEEPSRLVAGRTGESVLEIPARRID